MRGGSKRRSKDKYCDYHKGYGHDTEDCRNLSSEIDELVKKGALKKYLDRTARSGGKGAKGKKGGNNCAPPPKKAYSDDDQDDDSPTPMEQVYAITGLPVGTTKSSLKNEARRPAPEEPRTKRLREDERVVFSTDDPVPRVMPHQDAITIQAVIGNKNVHRVYVDIGASVSVMFQSCLDKLDVGGIPILPAPSKLRSFTQEATQPEGVITLPVTVGRAPRSVTKAIQFFLVKAPSPYNIILGRDWLFATKAVCSVYHLTVKIPTPGGVVSIRGDQAAAKECLRISTQEGTLPQA